MDTTTKIATVEHEHPVYVLAKAIQKSSLSTNARKTLFVLVTALEILGVVGILWSQTPDFLRVLAWLVVILGFGAGVVYMLYVPMAGIIRDYQNLEHERTVETERCSAAEGVHRCLSRSYGFVRDRVELTLELKPNGSASILHTVTARTLGTKVTELRHYQKGGSTGGGPQKEWTVKSNMIECPVEHEFGDVTASQNGLEWSIKFRPELPVDVPATYTSTVRAPQGTFRMNKDDVIGRAFPWEWIVHEIVYPSERLDIVVMFPKGYNYAQYEAQVWCDKGKLVNQAETRRIELGHKIHGITSHDKTRQGLKLSVEYPILGMRYAVLWVPREPRRKRTKGVR